MIHILRWPDIPEFKALDDMCELSGTYVNMESELPDGTIGILLDDNKTYVCCQVPINETCSYNANSHLSYAKRKHLKFYHGERNKPS